MAAMSLSLSPAYFFRWVFPLRWPHAVHNPHSCNCLLSCLPSSVSVPMPGISLPSQAWAPLPLLHLSSQHDEELKPIHSPLMVRTITISPVHGHVDPVQLSRSFLSSALLASLLGATSPSSPFLVSLARGSRQESLERALAKPVFGEATLEALAPDCGRAQPLLSIP